MSSMPFDLDAIAQGLAFGPSRHELYQRLAAEPSLPLVVQAPPGSGKTTIVPPVVANALAEAGLHGKVIVTQPRRVAARAAARRLAQLDGSPLGGRAGFAVRGERKSSDATKVEFVTAGLMLRRLLAEPDLDGISAVVIDEVHERSIETDLLLAMVNQVSQLRDDLALVVMSATLQAGELSELLSRSEPAPVISAETSQHEVTAVFDSFTGLRTTERGLKDEYLKHVAQVAVKHAAAVNQNSAAAVDALVFVPGAREVDRVCSYLSAAGASAFALHSQISPAQQDAILSEPGPAVPPRIIVSTSIAESSLTVPRVHLVVDAGYSREPRRDEGRGFSGLVTVVASRAAATQRAGRAGRLGPGRVVRTLDEKSFAAAPAHSAPEIRTGDLVSAVLDLAAWGTPRGEGLDMWEQPPAAALRNDEAVLASLEAVDAQGAITDLGARMARVPADPRVARALLDGAAQYGARPAAEAVAVLSSSERSATADLVELQRALKSSSHPGHRAWKQEAARFEKLAAGQGTPAYPGAGASEVMAGICALAYPLWVARKTGEGEYLLASGTRAELPRGSHLGHYEYLAVAEAARTGAKSLIRRAAGISFDQVEELLPQLHTVEDLAVFAQGKVSARRLEKFGAIELSSNPIKASSQLARQAIAQAFETEGLALFGEHEQFDKLRRRLAAAHRLLGEPFLAMDEQSLAARAEDWLGPVFDQLASGKPAAKVDLHQALRTQIPWEHAHDFDALVPERLQVPSGSSIEIQYPPADEEGPAVVAVKLQECFGLAESPRLVQGRLPVQFHLLSPARRPLAVTEDLMSFFNGPYAQVRAEMRGRYPKHPWPENPWEHVATAATKSKLSRQQPPAG